MRILGITGGVATGKSTVTSIFGQLGAPVVSADGIARDLLRPGKPVTRTILAAFSGARDTSAAEPDTIDRLTLGRIIFADPDARARLEAIIHPPIIAQLTDEIAALRAADSPKAAAIEIPLLFECSLEHLVDMIVVVACSEPLQVERLCRRTGILPDEARRQISSQWPLSEKIAKADIVIDSSGPAEALEPQVTKIWETL